MSQHVPLSVSTREALLRRCNLRTPTEELYRLLARHARDAGESAHLQRLAALEAGSRPELGRPFLFVQAYRHLPPEIEAVLDTTPGGNA